MRTAIPPRFGPARPSQLAWLLLGAALILLASSILFLFNPAQNSFYPGCLFHRLTGWHCPGCGSLRALHHLLHARFAGAFQCNPLLILLLPVATWRAALAAGLGPRRKTPPKPVAPSWVFLLVFTVLLFTVLRNLPFPQFSWMRP